jgi:hypothetical protein
MSQLQAATFSLEPWEAGSHEGAHWLTGLAPAPDQLQLLAGLFASHSNTRCNLKITWK